MCPLVDLISVDSEDDSKYASPCVGFSEEVISSEINGSKQKWRHGVGSAGIRFYKAMSGDLLGINMMHPKASYDSWPKNRGLELAPSVASPMEHA